MSTISVEIPQAAPNTSVPLPLGGQGVTPPSTVQGLDIWLENFRKYEATLQEVTSASTETKFKAELATVEQWFKVLPEPERTASVYSLLLHSNQDQIRFFISALQQMIRPDIPKPDTNETTDDQPKPKQPTRSVRPPSLNLPLPGSPTTPTPTTAKESAASFVPEQNDNVTPALQNLLSNAGKDRPNDDNGKKPEGTIAQLPGLGMMSPFHLNMIANAGLSTEAQLLAAQLVMSGLVQPTGLAASPAPRSKKSSHQGELKNWRTPTSAKYPGSALKGGLRTAALKTAGLKSAGLQSAALQSAGLQSAGLDSPSSMATPKEEDFNPEMLNDIPAWLRSLRLHKYTSSFDGLTWQEMVVLDDATLESKGIAALGARRRLLRTFEHVRKRMGMENPDSATPTTSALPGTPHPSAPVESKVQSAVPSSKLSVNSPVFTPTWERGPHSAAPTVSVTPPDEIGDGIAASQAT
ncbi:hypothetical protein BDZ94DRAFT_1156219 [Collybia nuda]|uniref:SAM domain-containing protein n=1 Tax=Collybia nuda TaxID=64659 RepID=A0A9P5YC29_9AGAR|nr:hypothetical protein BDZ94DRAFT_1156219 [Collybia nuda]